MRKNTIFLAVIMKKQQRGKDGLVYLSLLFNMLVFFLGGLARVARELLNKGRWKQQNSFKDCFLKAR